MSRQSLIERGLWDLVTAACAQHYASPAEVMAGRRLKSAVKARATACAWLYEKLDSYVEVGRLMGMDHTSVIEAVRRYRRTNGGEGNGAIETDTGLADSGGDGSVSSPVGDGQGGEELDKVRPEGDP